MQSFLSFAQNTHRSSSLVVVLVIFGRHCGSLGFLGCRAGSTFRFSFCCSGRCFGRYGFLRLVGLVAACLVPLNLSNLIGRQEPPTRTARSAHRMVVSGLVKIRPATLTSKTKGFLQSLPGDSTLEDAMELLGVDIERRFLHRSRRYFGGLGWRHLLRSRHRWLYCSAGSGMVQHRRIGDSRAGYLAKSSLLGNVVHLLRRPRICPSILLRVDT